MGKRNKEVIDMRRRTFERMLVTHVPAFAGEFSLDPDGEYLSPTVRSAYSGFLLGSRYGKKYGKGADNKCIIGRVDEKGIPHFSKNPFLNENQLAAEVEAARLITIMPEHSFSIYRFVKTIRGKKEEA